MRNNLESNQLTHNADNQIRRILHFLISLLSAFDQITLY